MLATYRGVTRTHTVPGEPKIKPFKLIHGLQYEIHVDGYHPEFRYMVGVFRNGHLITVIPYNADWKEEWVIDEY